MGRKEPTQPPKGAKKPEPPAAPPHAGGQCGREMTLDEWVGRLPSSHAAAKGLAKLKKSLAGHESALRYSQEDLERAREECKRLLDERDGSVWLWQGDGEDDPRLTSGGIERMRAKVAVEQARSAARAHDDSCACEQCTFARLDALCEINRLRLGRHSQLSSLDTSSTYCGLCGFDLGGDGGYCDNPGGCKGAAKHWRGFRATDEPKAASSEGRAMAPDVSPGMQARNELARDAYGMVARELGWNSMNCPSSALVRNAILELIRQLRGLKEREARTKETGSSLACLIYEDVGRALNWKKEDQSSDPSDARKAVAVLASRYKTAADRCFEIVERLGAVVAHIGTELPIIDPRTDGETATQGES